mmetsp:Transcript_38650/g.125011  ORF Transcript_38650/g.125011 Transcript_38650/m.125011 type:complete len:345 (+) Transcript_38650:533-1567(+)
MVIASACARSVGMRTHVQETGRSGRSMILRVSQVTLRSSLVYLSSRNLSMCGITLKGRGCAKTSLLALPPLAIAFVPSSSSAMPGAPAPEAAWYVDMMTRRVPNCSCSGASAMSAMAVVQFGFAMSLAFARRAASALISGTTSGTPSLYRKADELSITSAPPSPSEIFSAHSSAKSPETARKTMSHSRAAARENSSICSVPEPVSIGWPADRADAKSRSSDTGKPRSPSTATISCPTAPVTPTTPTFFGAMSAIMSMGATSGRRRQDHALRAAVPRAPAARSFEREAAASGEGAKETATGAAGRAAAAARSGADRTAGDSGATRSAAQPATSRSSDADSLITPG